MKLFSRKDMLSSERAKPQWFQDEYRHFHDTVTDPQFPCYLGTQAEKNGEVYYTYVEEDWSDLPRTIEAYMKVDRQSRGAPLTLAAFFKPEPSARSLNEYKNRFWEVLRFLHKQDPKPWPEDKPIDPDEYLWLFCFNGESFVVFANTPLYEKRKSRNLGNSLVIVFQPLALFAAFMPGKSAGVKARRNIRAKIDAYDEIPIHPALGDEQGSIQHPWQHFFLPDDNEPVQGKCPFQPHRQKKLHRR
ncbi:YqcI/YcgG family protein [Desmospora profundinema]|uniref:FPC/CPF motif-containing protein YcgG n=1 Tax=Desmospora profundinema TaxID=1571184 RepID=A0ABU1INS8_9BACL|nr:YqcI/YcgG family protein [Desmospora profundinema]MDR6226177.1 FPC/CPF motif-containing protein YcgG [Desmospora profundinema]